MLENRVRFRIPEAFQDLLLTRAAYYGYYGGRGSAKSSTIARALVTKAASFQSTEADPDHRTLCAREHMRHIAESVKRDLEEAIYSLGAAYMFHATENVISASNGAWFGFYGLANEAPAVRSMKRIKFAWMEEAQQVSQFGIDTVEPVLRVDGGALIASWNPMKPTDPIDRLFRSQTEPPDPSLMIGYDKWMIAKRVYVEDNPWFPNRLRALMDFDRRRDAGRFAHVWLGEYLKISDAQVFTHFRIGTMPIPEGKTPVYGGDWGFSVDPTVGVKAYIFEAVPPAASILYVEQEVWEVGCEIDKTPALFDRIDNGKARLWPWTTDSARPETIAYMRGHGYPNMKGARKGPGSVEEGVEFLKTFDIVVHPNCKHVFEELALYSFEVDAHTQRVIPKFADTHNHTIDALRYAVEDYRRTPAVAIPIIEIIPRTYFGDMPPEGGMM